jgi:alkylation response protein AidB-like acyl-CoA dehydrogenase
MDFLLSAEQRRMQDELEKMLADVTGSRDLHALIDGDEGMSREAWRRLSDFGALGACIPATHGGLGLEMIDLALIAEVVGRRGAGVPLLGHALCALAISWGGDEALKAKWLPVLAVGEMIGAVAFSEDEDHWQPDEWRLPVQDRITGEKRNVPNGREAGLFLVGADGGRLGLVAASDPGVSIKRVDSVDRTRPLDVVRLSDASVAWLAPDRALAERVRDAGLALLAADAFGGAERCISMAVSYAKTREQFGVPIARFQALRHQLANMALATEPCRGLYWYAAHAIDHLPDAAPLAAAQAKAHIAETFLQVARDMIEAHGGIGYTWEADAHIWLKRAMFDFAWLGAPARHRARAASLSGW